MALFWKRKDQPAETRSPQGGSAPDAPAEVPSADANSDAQGFFGRMKSALSDRDRKSTRLNSSH